MIFVGLLIVALIDICKCSLQKQNADQWSAFLRLVE